MVVARKLAVDSPPTVAESVPARERLLVCIGPSPGSERLLHATQRLAKSMNVPWHAVHVSLEAAAPLSRSDRDRVDAHLTQAELLGAEIAYLVGASIATSVLEFARAHGVTRIVAGKPTHPRWRDRLRGSFLDQLIRDSGAIEIHVIAPAVDTRTPAIRTREPHRTRAYLSGFLAVAVATVVGLLATWLSLPDHAMLYLAAIMLAALGGRAPGIFAAALSVAAYNFFFIPPRYTLAVADVDHVITFVVMFTVGTAIGTLVARLRHAEAASRQRERRTSALLAFTSLAAAARDAADVAAAVVGQIENALAAPTVVFLPDASGALEALAGLEPLAPNEMAVARYAHEHKCAAGRGTDTLPNARLLAMPLLVGDDSAGVVAVEIDRARRRIDIEARILVEAMARQAGVAIARLRLAREARDAALRAHAEELRSSLLSTVSHDLRTPLAVITGMATALRDAAPALTTDQLESLDTIVEEANRLSAILHNLLAITRVESGVTLRRDWVPLEELVGAAVGRCEVALARHPLALDVDADAGANVDAILFEQVLINLLENAAKHTPAGTPVELHAVRRDDEIVIEVSDRGPGLPAGEPAHLFEKFVRGAGVRSNGAGLGLAVCRGITLAHGGRIEAERRAGGGATFRVHVAGGVAPAADELDAKLALA